MKQVTTTQQVMLGPISATDRKGNPAPIEDVRVETVTGEGILEVIDDPNHEDPTVVILKPTGPLGTTTLRVTADAKIGEEVLAISQDLEFEVVSALASKLNIPQVIIEQPEEAPPVEEDVE